MFPFSLLHKICGWGSPLTEQCSWTVWPARMLTLDGSLINDGFTVKERDEKKMISFYLYAKKVYILATMLYSMLLMLNFAILFMNNSKSWYFSVFISAQLYDYLSAASHLTIISLKRHSFLKQHSFTHSFFRELILIKKIFCNNF